jgi:hypothetical protein
MVHKVEHAVQLNKPGYEYKMNGKELTTQKERDVWVWKAKESELFGTMPKGYSKNKCRSESASQETSIIKSATLT